MRSIELDLAAAGCPDDQLRRDLLLEWRCLVLPVSDSLQQQIYRGRSDLTRGQLHCRERRRQEVGEGIVPEADDHHIIGNPDLVLGQRVLRRPDLGTISVGAAGDLLLLDGNPFDDPSVVWDESRPRTVIQSGVVIHS